MPSTTHSELTPREREAWEFMLHFQQENGFAPASRDIAAATGHASPTSALTILKSLVRKGRVVAHRRNIYRRYVAVVPQAKPKEEQGATRRAKTPA